MRNMPQEASPSEDQITNNVPRFTTKSERVRNMFIAKFLVFSQVIFWKNAQISDDITKAEVNFELFIIKTKSVTGFFIVNKIALNVNNDEKIVNQIFLINFFIALTIQV
jgi:hypothetical protein